MNDFRDLKAIAEVCKQHQPLRFMRSHGALYIRNDSGIVFDVHQNRSFPEFMAQNKDYADLVLAANPETILALIAENQRLGLKADSLEFAKWSCQVNEQAVRAAGHETIEDLAEERDQLKAENEALRSVMACVVNEIPNHTSRNGNAPGHCHAIPGVWDQGNGAKSGTECAWCKVWNAATAMSKERPLAYGSEQGSISAETPAQQRSACRSENP